MNKTLLFVSDNSRLLRTWKRWFSRSYACCTADSGDQALTFLAARSVDIIISEINLGDMDGKVLLQMAAVQFPNAQRLLATESADPLSIQDLLAKGVIHKAVTNPWDQITMSSVIHSLANTQFVGDLSDQEPVVLNEPEREPQLPSSVDKIPAIMLLDKDQSHKNSIRMQCRKLHLRTYSISNFNYAKETLVLRPDIGLVVMSVDANSDQALDVVEQIRQIDRPVVTVSLLDDKTFRHSSFRFIHNESIYRCYSKPLPAADIVSMLKSGLRQTIKLQRIAALEAPSREAETVGRLNKFFNIFNKTA